MRQELVTAVEFLKKRDRVLCDIIDKVGECSLEPSQDYYTSLTKSIVYQQLSNKAAKTIYYRFLDELGSLLNPRNVLALDGAQFRRAGISVKKEAYLRDLSKKFSDGSIDVKVIPRLNDEELMELITSIKGIGRWSAEMFLIFCLNRPNVLPLQDLGLKRSLKRYYRLKAIPEADHVRRISKKWGGYRSIAVWYLWQALNRDVR